MLNAEADLINPLPHFCVWDVGAGVPPVRFSAGAKTAKRRDSPPHERDARAYIWPCLT
jgi:hypothetical protein